jgi:hypothetical protein
LRTWGDRPIEQRTLLNPAFLALLLNETASDHQNECGDGLPFLLAFLAIPVVLHAPTRERLPRDVRTSIPAWLSQVPEARVQIPPLACQLVPGVKEAIRFGSRHGALKFREHGSLVAADLGRSPRGMSTEDVSACRSRSRFIGRWFARAGDPTTILALWGLSP